MQLIANGPGIGDAFVLTCVAHELVRQRGIRPTIVSAYPELFWGNPDVAAVEQLPAFGLAGERTFKGLDDMGVCQGEPMLNWMLQQLGMEPLPWEALRCYAPGRLSSDPTWPPRTGNYVTIHVQPGGWTRTRDWLLSSWQAVADQLQQERGLAVVQIGGPHDPPLSDVVDWRGAPLRRVLDLIEGAGAHFGCVSGTMHLASAFQTPAVIVYGGREVPRVTGYAHHQHMIGWAPCAPCWALSCPYVEERNGEHWRPCIESISSDAVVGALVVTSPIGRST